MRKAIWIVGFFVLAYLGFRYLKQDRTLQSPYGLASGFGRALIRNDTATLESYVQGEARQDLERVLAEFVTLPRGPANAFRISSGGGASSAGVMVQNVELFNGQGNLLMTVSAYMNATEDGWRISRLRSTKY